MTSFCGNDSSSSQRVAAALRVARERIEAADKAAAEPIAVIGMGCRFPAGASDPAAYWDRLAAGFDAVREIPGERYDTAAYYDPLPATPGALCTRHAALIDGIDRFDPAFFGISPREAMHIDPQQRLLLEVAWEALEHAGQAPDRLRGSRTGVFIGIGRSDHGQRALGGRPGALTAWDATGNGLCYGPGRLSHLLDLQGPNLAIDSACASSLVAVHLACQSLRLRECHLALAGGCHVHLSPLVPIMMSMSRALAPDGRCKAFDSAADGFGQGEGCGVVVLRRLSDALERGDTILALIRGSAVNHDGHSSGLTVPNQAAQRRVIADALANARVAARDIGYIEAHGTGTPLGDPIEIEALAAALCGDGRSADEPLLVGSVKTNMGHLEAAAGIAGLIKVVLALGHQTIPPNLHFRTPSPRIDWPALPLAVPTRATPWPRAAHCAGNPLQLAGVSSFGMSGTNAHVVLQAAPGSCEAPASEQRPVHVVTLSARSPAEVRTQAAQWAAHLRTHPELTLADVARTATAGRAHFAVRAGLVATGLDDCLGALSAVADGTVAPRTVADEADADACGVAFLFPGQGAQHAHMARGLYHGEPVFRRCIERCDAVYAPQAGTSLVDLLLADAGDPRLEQTASTQPLLFALQCALTELWREWGVVPRAVLGHSLGEYAAAYAAGVFGLEDGMRLVAGRARLMQALPGGAMAAVAAGEAQVQAALAACGDVCRREVAIAAVNGERRVVVAGPAGPLQTLLDRLAADGAASTPLKVSHAFHSPMLEPMLGPLADLARHTPHGAPQVPCVANVTGRMHEGTAEGWADDWAGYWANYWAAHARQPVRFAAGLDTLRRLGTRAWLEIGSGRTLLALAASRFADDPPVLLPSLMPGRDEFHTLAGSLAALYERGVPVDWEGVRRGRPGRLVALPTYPFQRQRCWNDGVAPAPAPAPQAHRPLPGYRMAWRPQPAAPTGTPAPRQWWIVDAPGGPGARIAAALERLGQRVHVVGADAGLQCRLAEPAGAPVAEGVLWCAHGGAALDPGTDLDAWLTAQARECGALATWLQHLAAAAGPHTPGARLWVLTRGAVGIDTSDATQGVASAGLRAFAQSAAVEHAAAWGGLADLPADPTDADLAAVAAELAGPCAEDAVAWRGGRRWVARVEVLPVRHEPPPPAVLRADASYLVTGGLGALGLRMAAWLASRGARHLLLIGRQAPSPSAQQAIDALRRQGVAVSTACADVADGPSLQRLVESLNPPLRGVVHAAGAFGHAPLHTLDPEGIGAVLRAKVLGAAWLHRLTATLDLDLFVMFSSVAGWWGSKGQAHYAAANAFLDALARHRAARGLPAISLAWGPWQDGGMVTAEAQDWLARAGVHAMAPDAALAAMERHLAGNEPNVAIADIDWPRLRDVHPLYRSRPLLECVAPADAEAPGAGPQAVPAAEYAQLTPAARRDWLVGHVQRRVAGVLAQDPAELLDPRKGLFRLGMDSLMAVELKHRLAQDFGLDLPSTLVFDSPCIAALADTLADRLGGLEDAGAPPPPADRVPDALAGRIARLESLVRAS